MDTLLLLNTCCDRISFRKAEREVYGGELNRAPFTVTCVGVFKLSSFVKLLAQRNKEAELCRTGSWQDCLWSITHIPAVSVAQI